MKTILLAFTLCGFPGLPAGADGYPFDPSSQLVLCDSLRVRLSDGQVETLSSTGLVTLTGAQLTLIHRFYPKANKTQSVICATFNDNHEGLSDEDVYVFWVAAEEIAVTLNPKVIADKNLRDSALAEAGSARPSEIRIAPSGGIYMDGKPATLKDAFEAMIRMSTEPGLTHRQVNVCVAPPFRSLPHRELDQKVENLFASLARHGKAHSVVVSKSW
jgi:hypothetical protein